MAVYYMSASQKGEHMQTPGQQGETVPIFLSGKGLGKPTLISLVYMRMRALLNKLLSTVSVAFICCSCCSWHVPYWLMCSKENSLCVLND